MRRTLPYLKNWLVLFLVLFALTSSWAQRQERLTGLRQIPLQETSSIVHKAQANPLTLPFSDDFSYPSQQPNSTLWENKNVFINQTLAKSPITLGVASFDGLDSNGFAYDLNRQSTARADVLTSRAIDLSNPSDSVYLSFYYQAGGWAEPPSTEDSLTLEFWNSTDTIWNSVWRTFGGGNTNAFNQVLVAVNPLYFNSDFKFRFISYGSQAGTFDVWHLDYVKLDDQRTFNDTLLRDIAFTRPHPSLLQRYEALPWFHVERIIDPSQIAKPDIRLHYRRNVDPNQPRPNTILGEFTIKQNGTTLDQNGQPDTDLDMTHNPLEETRYPVPDTADPGRPRLSFLPATFSEETTLVSSHYYSGGGQTYSVNDTVIKNQHFKNYYAYDDGSAERGYEILNNQDGFMVRRFDLIGRDTLRGVYLYFTPAFYNAEDNEFTIIALENNGGIPGQILFESDSVYQPQYTPHNFYLPYPLDSVEQLAILNQTVFIGIRQKSNTPLTLGYDANAPANIGNIFYGKVNDLYQSGLPGALMIRPYFRYQPADLSATEPKTLTRARFSLYPNPSSGLINLKPPQGSALENLSYQVHNLSGQLLQKGPAQAQLNIDLPKGLYLFTLRKKNGLPVFTSKLYLR